MSDISEEEKQHQINTSFEVDRIYLDALDALREELIGQGIDIDSGEGRKVFIGAVRKLNERFLNTKCHEMSTTGLYYSFGCAGTTGAGGAA
jgi:hypothetical protein